MCWPREWVVDWDSVYNRVQPYATFTAGVVFGLGWWVWADAMLYSAAVDGQPFRALLLAPGIVATLAVALMNMVGREDVDADYADDATTMRSKLVLFLSYLVSIGAIVGAVVLLVQAQRSGGDMWVGASGVLQCCLVLASGMLCWFFHGAEDSPLGYGYL